MPAEDDASKEINSEKYAKLLSYMESVGFSNEVHRHYTFNNVRTLKFKTKPTVAFFTAVNQLAEVSENEDIPPNKVQRSRSCAVTGGFCSTL